MTDDADDREQGVEFGPLWQDLESVEYPASKATLLDQFGDRSLELTDGDKTFREVIEPLGEERFESPQDVRDSVVGMVGDDAVGREGYSDRGGHAADENEGESI